ncbi:MAG: NADPH:quinone oxidoreductase family protein [Pseudomonadota bacterium]
MKIICAEQFGPPQALVTLELPAPEAGRGEILIDVAAAGVGYVDGLMIQGLYQVKPPLPYFPGSEFMGVVAQLGADVQTFKVGDRVMGLASSGAYAEQLSIRADRVIPVPDELSNEIAAGFYINYATALYGLRDCGALKPGETILILGAAGGVGSAAISVAKAMGARVIAGASTMEKRQAALVWGADEVVDYTQPDWRAALEAITPEGLNLVYDPVGGALSEAAFRSLAPGGRFLVVGFASGTIPSIPLNLALLKRSSIVGVDWGGDARANPAINGELLNTLMAWIAAGKLTPCSVVARPMSQIRDSLDDQLAGNIIGKLVLVQAQ